MPEQQSGPQMLRPGRVGTTRASNSSLSENVRGSECNAT